MLKKSLLIIILLLIAVAAALQVDDKLSAESTKLISAIDPTTSSEAFLFLTGIYASENQQPSVVGQAMFDQFQRAQTDDSYRVVAYPDINKISLPQGPLFCQTWQVGCLETLFNSDSDLNKLYKQHQILVQRANIFHRFSEYTTLTKPTISEQYPAYTYLATASRLTVLLAISTYQSGQVQPAINALFVHLKALRHSLALQDNLIGKLVFLSKLSEILDVASIMLNNSNGNGSIKQINALSEAEKDFSLISAREFAMTYYTFKRLDKNPDFFELGANFPGWITRMLYKPNMSINATAPFFTRLERLAALTPAEFAIEIANNREVSPSSSRVRNYIGNVLVAISPSFDKYVARFMDFEAKIVLFNQRYFYHGDLHDAKNPFYSDQTPNIYRDRGCFSGPLVDQRSMRCVATL